MFRLYLLGATAWWLNDSPESVDLQYQDVFNLPFALVTNIQHVEKRQGSVNLEIFSELQVRMQLVCCFNQAGNFWHFHRAENVVDVPAKNFRRFRSRVIFRGTVCPAQTLATTNRVTAINDCFFCRRHTVSEHRKELRWPPTLRCRPTQKTPAHREQLRCPWNLQEKTTNICNYNENCRKHKKTLRCGD